MYRSLIQVTKKFFGTKRSPVQTYGLKGTYNNGRFIWTSNKTEEKFEVDEPLEGIVACMCTCEIHTAEFFAKKLGINLKGFEIKNVEADYDIRNFSDSPNSPNRFTQIRMEVLLDTDASDEQINELKEKVHGHCPIYRMIAGSGVEIKDTWTRK